MLKRILPLVLIANISLLADYETGKNIFQEKCSTCHKGHIDLNTLKENFFEKNNTLLRLTVPTVNMLAYAIMDSPKHIGDNSDKEMQKVEIESYLYDYLEAPDLLNSVCDTHILKYYEEKKPMKNITEEEVGHITDYIMEYKERRLKENPPKEKENLDKDYFDKVLQRAKKENKVVIIEAMSPSCYFCKIMKKEVLSKQSVKNIIDKNFIFVEVNTDKYKLPYDLTKYYKGMSPTFFMVSKDGKYKKDYIGSWGEKDFIEILNENK